VSDCILNENIVIIIIIIIIVFSTLLNSLSFWGERCTACTCLLICILLFGCG